MGLFDLFKKKEEPKRQNTTNSVYTLKFAIPFFSIFDKTDKSLEAFPIKLAIGGSVQYRITEPDLCFDNVPLGEMSPAQLEEHVKDSLTSTIKTFISGIDTIPVLQFESALGQINEAAKAKLVPSFDEEFGISLRAFNITRFTYDEEDPNYIHLKSLGTSALERKEAATIHRAELKQRHEDEDLEEERERIRRQRKRADQYKEEDEQEERERRKRLRRLQDDEELSERENRLRTRQQQHDLERRKAQHQVNKEIDNDAIDAERKRLELKEYIHAQRTATDSGAKLSDFLAKRKGSDSNGDQASSQTSSKADKDGLDLGPL